MTKQTTIKIDDLEKLIGKMVKVVWLDNSKRSMKMSALNQSTSKTRTVTTVGILDSAILKNGCISLKMAVSSELPCWFIMIPINSIVRIVELIEKIEIKFAEHEPKMQLANDGDYDADEDTNNSYGLI